jgi:polyisoprenoid-binding protein YceI
VTDAPTPPLQSPPPERAGGRRRHGWWWAGLAGLLVVAVAGVSVWYFVFRDTAPPEVDIDTASKSVEQNGRSTTSTTGTSTAATAASGLDGTWTIDDSIGKFDAAGNVFTSAFVGYRVNEQLAGVGAKTAFGRTPDVTGSLTIDGTTATKAEFTADLTTLQSDDSRRDGQLRTQAIQTNQFPTATFVLTEPIDFETLPADDTTVSVEATGDLTLHGVTSQVTIPLDAKVVNGTIVVTGLLDIRFADYGISKPSSAAVLSVEDTGKMEVQLFFTRK